MFRFICVLMLTLTQCRLDEAPIRNVRGHEFKLAGIAHAAGAASGERLCQGCHGLKLFGGSNGEPSCYQCHGNVWTDRDPNISAAPSGHETEFGGFYHHIQYSRPVGTCDAAGCHGAGLVGTAIDGTPSCYTCHAQVW